MSGPIPAGSPDRQRESWPGPQRPQRREFDHRGPCGFPADRPSTSPRTSARTTCRGSRVSAASPSLVGLRSHSATISTPCLVTSGGVRWPIGVLSSMLSAAAAGRSADVLIDDCRGSRRRSWFGRYLLASSQLWTRLRRASASLRRDSGRRGAARAAPPGRSAACLYSKPRPCRRFRRLSPRIGARPSR